MPSAAPRDGTSTQDENDSPLRGASFPISSETDNDTYSNFGSFGLANSHRMSPRSSTCSKDFASQTFGSGSLGLSRQPTAAGIMEQRRVKKYRGSSSWNESDRTDRQTSCEDNEKASGQIIKTLLEDLIAQHTSVLQNSLECECKDIRSYFDAVYEKLDDMMMRLDEVDVEDHERGSRRRFSRIAALGQPRKPGMQEADVRSPRVVVTVDGDSSVPVAPSPREIKANSQRLAIPTPGSRTTENPRIKKVEINEQDIMAKESKDALDVSGSQSSLDLVGRQTSKSSLAKSISRSTVTSLMSRGHSALLEGVAGRTMEKIARTKRGKTLSRIWSFLEEPSEGSWSAVYVKFSSFLVIVSSLFTIVHYESLDGLLPLMLDFTFDILFSLEVAVRFIACPNHLLFFRHYYNWLDILSGAVPLIMRAFAEVELSNSDSGRQGSALEIVLFCFVPVVRILKLLRHFEEFHLLQRAFQLAFEALPVLFYTQTILILGFGSLMYMVEPRDNIPSLSISYWFAIVTMSTVGYGGVVPRTLLGHLIASALIVCGSLYMAIPLGIVGNAFHEVWGERDRLLVMKRTKNRLLMGGYSAEDIPALFALFDLDKSGDLTVDEFSKMIRNMNVALDECRLRKLFEELDTDGGGSIDDKEFVRVLFPKHYEAIYGAREDEEDSGDNSRSTGPPSRQTSPEQLPPVQRALRTQAAAYEPTDLSEPSDLIAEA